MSSEKDSQAIYHWVAQLIAYGLYFGFLVSSFLVIFWLMVG